MWGNFGSQTHEDGLQLYLPHILWGNSVISLLLLGQFRDRHFHHPKIKNGRIKISITFLYHLTTYRFFKKRYISTFIFDNKSFDTWNNWIISPYYYDVWNIDHNFASNMAVTKSTNNVVPYKMVDRQRWHYLYM